MRTYSELVSLPTYLDRYNYLRIGQRAFQHTFGNERYLNQALYQSSRWRNFRRSIIIRDRGCDMAVDGYEINGPITIHHLNPLQVEDLEIEADCIFDPENVVCVSMMTHEAIHYGSEELLMMLPPERRPNDTKLW